MKRRTFGAQSVWIGHTVRPFDFESPCEGKEFALLLVVEAKDVSPEEQSGLSEQFVRQGCRYAVCFGHECSLWDDSIDMVGVMAEIEGRPAPFVMTTWHAEESLEEVAWYFAFCTTFDDWQPEAYIVLLLGGDGEGEAAIERALEDAFLEKES